MFALSMFYGILIYMYKEINSKHNKPHIHAKYAEYEAVLSVDGELMEGLLPKGKMKLVEAWIEIHQEELAANWDLLFLTDSCHLE